MKTTNFTPKGLNTVEPRERAAHETRKRNPNDGISRLCFTSKELSEHLNKTGLGSLDSIAKEITASKERQLFSKKQPKSYQTPLFTLNISEHDHESVAIINNRTGKFASQKLKPLKEIKKEFKHYLCDKNDMVFRFMGKQAQKHLYKMLPNTMLNCNK